MGGEEHASVYAVSTHWCNLPILLQPIQDISHIPLVFWGIGLDDPKYDE